MTRVSLMLEYFHPWPNSAGFYFARERGWYADVGIDLEVRLFDRALGDTLEYLKRNEVHFGVFPSNRLLVRRERGEPLVGIAAVNHGGLETIQTIRRTGIRRPRDLERRRLALGKTPRGVAMVHHLIRNDGGDPAQVELVENYGREITVDDIAAGEIDATFGGYWAWDALFGALPESERITWRIDQLGAPKYHSYLLGTQEARLDASPDLVRRFLAATARGFQGAIAEPEAALTAIERAIPYFPRPLLRRSLELVQATWTHQGAWGIQREELLSNYSAWLERQGILKRSAIWRSAICNDFLPQATVST